MPIGLNEVVQVVAFLRKGGGWLVLAGAAICAFIQWQRVSLMECPTVDGYYTNSFGEKSCSVPETLDTFGLGTILVAAIVGACIGVLIALILVKLGVRSDTLGIDPDA